MRVVIVLLLGVVLAIPKKHISVKHKLTYTDVKLSQVDMALSQTDKQIENQNLHSQLKSEMANWAVAKSALIQTMQQCISYFGFAFSKQQQIGVGLVLVICFAFYLMVCSEDKNMKLKKQNIRKRKPESAPIQILTDSLMNQPQISVIACQIDERVNKSSDDAKQKISIPHVYRSKSQSDLFKNQCPADQSASEIASLLKDMN